MVKLRLQRHGRKGQPFYYIVAADARAPRDGRYIERIGSYNPNTNPATIDLNLDDAVRWLGNGAVPTDTCRAILSYKGAMYKNHLNRGVAKGAMTQEAADSKFAAWLEEKQNKVQAKREGLLQSATEAAAENLKREEAARAAKEKAIVEKNSPVAEEVAEVDPETSGEAIEVVASEEATETPAEEAPAEEVVASEEATETPIEAEAEVEAEVETPAEEVVASEETPAEDAGEKEDDSEEKTA